MNESAPLGSAHSQTGRRRVPASAQDRVAQTERLLKRAAPFFGSGVIAILLGTASAGRLDHRAQVAALMVAPLTAVTLFLPWERLPSWVQAIPLYMAVVLLFPLTLDPGPTSTLPYFTPALLPALWLALNNTRRELAVGLFLIVAVLVVPPLAGRAPGENLSRDFLYATLVILYATTVHEMSRRLREQASNATVIGQMVRQILSDAGASGTRVALCEGILTLTGGSSAVLYEPRSGDVLVATAAAGLALPTEALRPTWSNGRGGTPRPSPVVLAHVNRRQEHHRAVEAANGTDLPWPGIQTVLCQPVVRDGSTLGVIVVGWERDMRITATVAGAAGVFAEEAALLMRQSDFLTHLDSMSRTDSLTGVPNRRAWEEELQQRMARTGEKGGYLSVAILDLDHFKAFNDDWGHQRGDRLLAEVVAGWQRALRDSDFLARYGGDEFGLILPNCSAKQAEPILERMRQTLPDAQSCSVGVASWDWAETAAELVGRADTALYESKRNGRGRITVAPESRRADRLTNWVTMIPRILADRSITSVYQVVKDLDSEAVVGYEALARPAGVAADASVEALFTAAQRLGHLRDLDWLCRRRALEGAASLPAGIDLYVNVGVRALLDPVHPVDQMLLLLQWASRKPGEIVLEISEREAIPDLDRFAEVLAEYRAAGFRFALDDVGEGHSTMESLAVAQPEFIKLARSLVVNADFLGPGSVIASLVAFARLNGGQVIAEGVEDRHQWDLMRELGVTLGQGWALGKPAVL